jgi:hypothetical protein
VSRTGLKPLPDLPPAIAPDAESYGSAELWVIASRSLGSHPVALFRSRFPGKEVEHVLPSVEVEKKQLNWRITPVAPLDKVYDIRQNGAIEEVDVATATLPQAVIAPTAIRSEALAENDLHHFRSLKTDVENWIRDAGIAKDDIRGKAKTILSHVRTLLEPNAALSTVYYFTESDETILAARNPKSAKSQAMCDEYAVLTVTALRSIDIPARIKYFRWRDASGADLSHAAVEFEDHGKRISMDSALNLFNEPTAYRRIFKREKVHVIDADLPMDTRSQKGVTFGPIELPDVDGDGILDPYLDFVLQPDIAGEERDCYSRDVVGCP